MKKYYVIFYALFCLVVSFAPAGAQDDEEQESADAGGYPAIPLQTKGGKEHVPFITCFAQRGPYASLGKQLLRGTELYVQAKKLKEMKISHKGNIKVFGNKVLPKLRKLAKKSPLMVGLYGTRPLLSIIPALQKKEIGLLFPVEATSLVRDKKLESMVFYRPPHLYELHGLMDFAINQKMRNKIAIFYEASLWGDSVLASLKKVLEKHNLELVAQASYPEGTVAVAHAVKTISLKNPNAVLCVASPRAAYSFIRQGINSGLHKSLFLGLSNLHVIQSLLYSSRGMNIAVSSVVPNPATDKTELVTMYRKASEKYLQGIPLSPTYLEGFLGMAIFVDCLLEQKSDVSVQGLLEMIRGFKEKDLFGLTLQYHAAIGALSKSVWINPGHEEKWYKSSATEELL